VRQLAAIVQLVTLTKVGPHCVLCFFFCILRVEEIKLGGYLLKTGFFIAIMCCYFPSPSRFLPTDPFPFLVYACNTGYICKCVLNNKYSDYASPLAPILRHSVMYLFRSCAPSFFWWEIFSVVKEEGSIFLHQRRSLVYYMRNKNVVLHRIPASFVPISRVLKTHLHSKYQCSINWQTFWREGWILDAYLLPVSESEISRRGNIRWLHLHKVDLEIVKWCCSSFVFWFL